MTLYVEETLSDGFTMFTLCKDQDLDSSKRKYFPNPAKEP